MHMAKGLLQPGEIDSSALLQTVLEPVNRVSCFWSFVLFLLLQKLILNIHKVIILNALGPMQGLEINEKKKKRQKVRREHGQETKIVWCPMGTWIHWQRADCVLQTSAPNSSPQSLQGQVCPRAGTECCVHHRSSVSPLLSQGLNQAEAVCVVNWKWSGREPGQCLTFIHSVSTQLRTQSSLHSSGNASPWLADG